MLTLTAAQTLAADRPHAETIYLMTMEFSAPSAKTLYLSDRHITAVGREWLHMVERWGDLEAVLNTLDVDGSPAVVDGLALINTKPIEGRSRLSDLIRTPGNTSNAYEWAFAKVTISQLFAGGSDLLRLGVFFLEDPQEIGEDVLQLRMSDQSLVIENSTKVTRITRAEFPTCGKSRIGQSIRRPFGKITNVPAIPVVDGAVSQLNGAVTSSQTTITLLDATDFPASATGQFNSEQFTWTSKNATQLLGVTRGVNSTTAAAHDDRSTVFEARSGSLAYRYAVGEGLIGFIIKAITNVKVQDIPSSIVTIQLDASDVVTGKRFAMISFPVSDVRTFHAVPLPAALPLATNIPLVTDETIDSVGNNTWDRSMTVTLQSIPVPYTVIGTVHRKATITFTNVSGTFSLSGNNTISRVDPATLQLVQLQLDNTGPTLDFAATATYEYDTNGTVANEEFRLHLSGDADNFRFQWKITLYELSVATIQWIGTASGLGGDSTAAIVIGEVTCDVEGIQDDASGTISGTPSLLLENPADVVKFALLKLWPGVVASDLGASFAATRASLLAGGYTWGFLMDAEEFSKFRRRFGEQARSVFFLSAGIWQFQFLPDAPIAQKTLDYLSGVSVASPAVITRTPRIDIKNSLLASSQFDYTTNAYRRAVPHEDLTQPGLGEAFHGDLFLDLVQDEATAAALGAFWLSRWKRQRFLADAIAWWNVIEMEPIDYVSFANHPILEAHGGAGLVFRITGKTNMISDEHTGRIRLRMIEAGA